MNNKFLTNIKVLYSGIRYVQFGLKTLHTTGSIMQKIIFMTLLACSSSAFAGTPVPTPVSAPGTFVLMGLGVAAILYIAKKRKK
jgi:hypothetical protein